MVFTLSMVLAPASSKRRSLPAPPPPTFRWIVLLLIPLTTFSGHFFKNSLSSLEVFLLDDPRLAMTSTAYGALIGSFSASSLITPLIGGHIFDVHGHRSTLVSFLALSLLGIIFVTLSLTHHWFTGAVLGGLLFGAAHANVVVASRAVLSRYFHNCEINTALGVSVGVAALAKMSARASVAPVALHFSSYIYSFYLIAFVGLGSLVVGIVYVTLSNRKGSFTYTPVLEAIVSPSPTPDLEQFDLAAETTPLTLTPKSDATVDATVDHAAVESNGFLSLTSLRKTLTIDGPRGLSHRSTIEHDDDSASTNSDQCEPEQCEAKLSKLPDIRQMGVPFWYLVILHMLFLLVFHLFPNISGHYLSERWGYNPAKAGYTSSLLSAFTVIGAPITGLIIDRLGGQLYVCLAASILSMVAYGLLTWTWVDPVVPILLLSVAESIVPVIIMALIPLSVSRSQYGLAFGIAEIVDAMGSIVGNLAVGVIRDRTGSYQFCMVFIMALNAMHIVIICLLIESDSTEDSGVLNERWHDMVMRKKKAGLSVEKGRRNTRRVKGRAEMRSARKGSRL